MDFTDKMVKRGNDGERTAFTVPVCVPGEPDLTRQLQMGWGGAVQGGTPVCLRRLQMRSASSDASGGEE